MSFDRISKVLLPENSPFLKEKGVKIIYTYPDGKVLAILPYKNEDSDIEILSGLQAHRNSPTVEISEELTLEERTPEEIVLAFLTCIGPISPEWISFIEKQGITLLRYQPHYSYLCRGKVSDFLAIREKPFIESVIHFDSGYKMRPEILLESSKVKVWIVIQVSPNTYFNTLKEIEAFEGVELQVEDEKLERETFVRIKGFISQSGQEKLLKHPFVLAIEPFEEIQVEDEVAGLIIAGQYTWGIPKGDYLNWLSTNGINGKGVTIGIVDNGVDSRHEAFKNRIIDKDGNTRNWHGTFVAGHAAGKYLSEKDNQGFIYGLGVAPEADLISQSMSDVANNIGKLCKETVSTSGPSGYKGTVQNNSWGSGLRDPMNYTSIEAEYDKMVRNSDPSALIDYPLTICFSSGNKGVNGLTRPKAAKNIIVTGNSENYRPEDGLSESDNINDVYTGLGASSHGNCGDGRVRPHIVAPGQWTASANFGVPQGSSVYINDKLVWGGGSSGASPKTAGVCALLIQWWKNQVGLFSPSPAMLRALIVNGAEPMTRLSSQPPIPSKVQGWGRLNLGNIIDPSVHRTYLDQSTLLTQTTQKWEQKFRVSDPSRPIKVSLAWTDPPGNLGTGNSVNNPAIVNKLHLILRSDEKIYHGNNFSNGWSQHGILEKKLRGIDNLQNVFLPSGIIGETFDLCIEGLEITTNCFDFQPSNPKQDFALVISNAYPEKGSSPSSTYIVIDEIFDDYYDPYEDRDDGLDDDDWWDFIFEETNISELDFSENIPEGWWEGKVGPGIENNQQELAEPPLSIDEVEFSIQSGKGIIENEESENSELLILGLNSNLQGIENESLVQTFPPRQYFLEDELDKLVTGLQKPGPSLPLSRPIKRKVSILSFTSLNKLSKATFQHIKALAAFGDVYILSHSPKILAYIHEKVRKKIGVQYRLAESKTEIPSLIQGTIAESHGASELHYQQDEVSGEEGFRVVKLKFYVVSEDKEIKVFLRFQSLPQKARFKIRFPDAHNSISLQQLIKEGKADISQRENSIQFQFISSKISSWGGEWELEITTPENGEPLSAINIWSWGNISFGINHESLENDPSNFLIKVHSNFLTRFTNVELLIKDLMKKQSIEQETHVPIPITPDYSRVDFPKNGNALLESSPMEANAFRGTSELSKWIKLEMSGKGFCLVEIEAIVEGYTNSGNYFKRKIQNSLSLIPSFLNEKVLKNRKQFFIRAKIQEKKEVDGQLRYLKILQEKREKWLEIKDSTIQNLLFEIEIQDREVHLLVFENEILSINYSLM